MLGSKKRDYVSEDVGRRAVINVHKRLVDGGMSVQAAFQGILAGTYRKEIKEERRRIRDLRNQKEVKS